MTSSVTASGSLTAAEVRRFARTLGGRAAHRDDEAWEQLAPSRFPNPEVAWDPEVVVVPSGTADVIAATHFAGAHDLRIGVRAGGVGWCGADAGTLLLDLRALSGVRIDPLSQRVHVQGGALWREVGRELGAVGRAAAGAQFPALGVSGHVLGGGHGWLSRKLGWASDTLRAVDLVTADGRLVHVSAEHEPELFWAMRGAGHNFGTVVGLELETVPLERISFGLVWFHPDAVADVLRWCAEHLHDAPDELTAIVSVAQPGPGDPVPATLRGRAAPHVIVCHCGSVEQAQRDLAELRGHPAVVADTIHETTWGALATGPAPFASGVHRRSRMRYLHGIDDAVLEISARRAREMAPLSFMSTHIYGGAMDRLDEQATAMGHRHEHWNYMVTTSWTTTEDGAPLRVWQEAYLAELAPHAADAYYVNYLFDEPDHVAHAYHPTTWARLRDLKRVWDPDNRFAGNQNVPPAGTGAQTTTDHP
jgi:FAD/FMN-containing dehydrogenase